jgi:hypothetical protein
MSKFFFSQHCSPILTPSPAGPQLTTLPPVLTPELLLEELGSSLLLTPGSEGSPPLSDEQAKRVNAKAARAAANARKRLSVFIYSPVVGVKIYHLCKGLV